MRHLILSVVAAIAIIANGSQAEDRPPSRADQAGAEVRLPKTLSGKRQWLKEQAAKGVPEAQQRRAVQQVIDRLTAEQVDGAIKEVLAQQLPPAADAQQVLQEAQWELARARALRQYLEQLVLMQQGRVGYAPVITWLPEGTQLGASAMVSPDGRHVRINANPFFSSIGPVYTYNWSTGETYLQPQYPVQNRNPGYPNGASNNSYGGIPQWHLPPKQNPNNNVRVWYDGLRTRVEPK
jgi:hypothetical protein